MWFWLWFGLLALWCMLKITVYGLLWPAMQSLDYSLLNPLKTVTTLKEILGILEALGYIALFFLAMMGLAYIAAIIIDRIERKDFEESEIRFKQSKERRLP